MRKYEDIEFLIKTLYLEVTSINTFWVFEHDIQNTVGQDLAMTCPSAACIMVIYI